MSHAPNTGDHRRGTAAVEDSTTRSTATTGLVIAVLGLVAGLASVNGWLPAILGITAVVLGLIGLVTAAGAWKRGKDQTGEAGGTTGTNLAIAGMIAGLVAAVLGVVGIVDTAGVTDADEGVDQVEQEVDEVGDGAGLDN